MKTINEILVDAFNKMPSTFTSNQFNNTAYRNGFPKNITINKVSLKFLSLNAKNQNRHSKTWTKNTAKPTNPISLLTQLDKTDYSLDDAIRIVKGAGYKIMKPTTDWNEI